MAYLASQQAAYDAIASRPRAGASAPSAAARAAAADARAAAFAARLAETVGPSDAVAAAAAAVAVFDAKAAHRATARHFQWTRAVYEPVKDAVGDAVARALAARGSLRREAFAAYLAASSGRRGVFLDDHGRDYDAHALARTGVRAVVRVRDADPTIAALTIRRREAAIVDPAGASERFHSRLRETLPPLEWDSRNIASTMHGHFAIKEAAGAFDMAFAGRDTASSWRFETGVADTLRGGRSVEVDAEFPRGKRVRGYPQGAGGVPTGVFLPHRSVGHVYGAGVEPALTDATALDAPVRAGVQGALLPRAGATWRARHAVPYDPYRGAAEGKQAEPAAREAAAAGSAAGQ